MEEIRLVAPGMEHEAAVKEYIAEHIASGEDHLHGSGGLMRYERYEEWLVRTRSQQSETTVEPGLVPASMFLAERISDGKIVGMIQVRHRLNEYLTQFGGNIGYGVCPSGRRKGYGTEMLRQALEHCRELGIEKALVTCNQDNAASAGVIEKNGGILEDERVEDDGTVVKRYWIDVK